LHAFAGGVGLRLEGNLVDVALFGVQKSCRSTWSSRLYSGPCWSLCLSLHY